MEKRTSCGGGSDVGSAACAANTRRMERRGLYLFMFPINPQLHPPSSYSGWCRLLRRIKRERREVDRIEPPVKSTKDQVP